MNTIDRIDGSGEKDALIDEGVLLGLTEGVSLVRKELHWWMIWINWELYVFLLYVITAVFKREEKDRILIEIEVFDLIDLKDWKRVWMIW